jgi:hypothetical protein
MNDSARLPQKQEEMIENTFWHNWRKAKTGIPPISLTELAG